MTRTVGVEAEQHLRDLAQDYWSFEREETPFAPMLAGQTPGMEVPFRESGADHVRRVERAAELRQRLSMIDASAMPAQATATYKLLDRELGAVTELFTVQLHLRPWLLPGGPEFNTAFFANSSAVATVDDADLYVRRLATLPLHIDNLRENLLTGHECGFRYPRSVLTAAARSARAASGVEPRQSPWYGPFRRTPLALDGRAAELAQSAETVIAQALVPALHRYADALSGPLAESARSNLSCVDAPGGQDFYRAMVRYFTTTDMSPEDVHDLGLAEVERLEAALASVAASQGCGTTEYRARLGADQEFVAPSADALLQSVQSLCKRIDGMIPAWFARIPRATYGVNSIPADASSTLPPAYAQPGPADGSAPGLFWVSGLPAKCPSYLHAALAVHEAWPGHLMHIALLQELDDLPAFRRFGAVKYTACIEGWALYCESLADEMGLYASPAEQFGRLEMEMWRAARLVVDTGIHWYDWSRDKAIGYMSERLSLDGATIAAEVDRYAAMPGQALGYQIGNLKMRDLRARAERRLGPRFSHRAFHEAVMTAGAVTLPVLDDLIEDWLERSAVESRVAA